MSTLLDLFALSSLIPYIALIMVFFATLRYRKNFITVNQFSNENVDLPEVIDKESTETTVMYAFSLDKTNKFYLTNSRVVFFFESILKGKYYTKYFQIESVKNTEIVYKNPYGWLIIAVIYFIYGVISATRVSSTKSLSSSGSEGAFITIILPWIFTAVFCSMWYYLKGYYLVFDNNKVSGLFCRSKEGIVNVLKKFDYLKINKTKNLPPRL